MMGEWRVDDDGCFRTKPPEVMSKRSIGDLLFETELIPLSYRLQFPSVNASVRLEETYEPVRPRQRKEVAPMSVVALEWHTDPRDFSLQIGLKVSQDYLIGSCLPFPMGKGSIGDQLRALAAISDYADERIKQEAGNG
jgi:hypothetical protein